MTPVAEMNRGAKTPYTAPHLICYGSFKAIVQGFTGNMSEGTPGNTKNCWIAEALYGVDDLRTLVLRQWLTAVYDERRTGWPLVAVYMRYGRAAAELIRAYPALGRGIRPLFDVLLAKAFGDSARLVRVRAGKRRS